MVRSLVVILVPLLIITVVATRNLDDYPVDEVDWRPVLTKARAEAPYPVLAPSRLPKTWRATRVEWVPEGKPYLNGEPSARNLWLLGFLSPDKVYVGLVQGDLAADRLVEDTTREGRADGQSRLAETTWERRLSADERTRSLVWRRAEVTTIVSGDTSYEALEAYASTLSAD